MQLRSIFRGPGRPSSLEIGALAVGLTAAAVIIATLTDVAPFPSPEPDRKSMATASSPPTRPEPVDPVVRRGAAGGEAGAFTPRLLPQSAPREIDITPPERRRTPETAFPAWLRFAAATPDILGRPVIAIILDDMGLDRKQSERAVMLAAPLTLSYLPYARNLAQQTARARLRGHELMVHLPMEPLARGDNPGPRALLRGLPREELVKRLEWALSRFTGYVGVNNHMGSRLTRDSSAMALVMARLKAHGLLFVDSRTSIRSVAGLAARAAEIPNTERNIFLDHVDSPEAIRGQLKILERIARRQGFAVAIGHPRDATLDALESWMEGARMHGFVFVPISAIVRGVYSLG